MAQKSKEPEYDFRKERNGRDHSKRFGMRCSANFLHLITLIQKSHEGKNYSYMYRKKTSVALTDAVIEYAVAKKIIKQEDASWFK